ncbi:hypothetical protein VFA_002683 [Vibrio furnissii CIP 102972]|nr:hypothetical protein VFA_002683 [Vibrio furnissii CIP 102972]
MRRHQVSEQYGARIIRGNAIETNVRCGGENSKILMVLKS